jgi:hypothetical protein
MFYYIQLFHKVTIIFLYCLLHPFLQKINNSTVDTFVYYEWQCIMKYWVRFGLTLVPPPLCLQKQVAYSWSVTVHTTSNCIMSNYWLDDRATVVRSLAEANGFSSSFFVQTSYDAHPASCRMGTGGPFPGGKARRRCDADRSPPSRAEVKKKRIEPVALLLFVACMTVAGQLYHN